MGQSRTKVQRFLAANPNCIFCGGHEPATSQDHIPTRAIFIDRFWPEGYVFAACHKCNNDSSDAEYLVGIIAKIGWERVKEIKDKHALYTSFFLDLKRKKPEIFNKMQEKLPASKLKRLAKEGGYTPPAGVAYSETPIIKIPKEFDDAFDIFGKKLAKALHYKHTNKIPTINTRFKIRWATNFELLSKKFLLDENVLKSFTKEENIIRDNIDLTSQFSYSYVITEDENSSVFLCNFTEMFTILIFMSFDEVMMNHVNW